MKFMDLAYQKHDKSAREAMSNRTSNELKLPK